VAICTIVLALSFIFFPIGKGTGLAHFLLYNEQVFKPKRRDPPLLMSHSACSQVTLATLTMGVVSGFSIFFGVMVRCQFIMARSIFQHWIDSTFRSMPISFFSGFARYQGARPQEAVVLLPLEAWPLLLRVNAAVHRHVPGASVSGVVGNVAFTELTVAFRSRFVAFVLFVGVTAARGYFVWYNPLCTRPSSIMACRVEAQSTLPGAFIHCTHR
jgi:hypothetical protein